MKVTIRAEHEDHRDCKILLDDKDITRNLRSISLGMAHGEPNVVILELSRVQVDVDMVALVQRMVTSEHVANVLDGLDPARVEQEVLNSLGMGDKMVPALIKYLQEKIREF